MREKLKASLICFTSFMLFACGGKEQDSSLDDFTDVAFTAVLKWQNEVVDCGNWLSDNVRWQINSLAFFMSNMTLKQGVRETQINSKDSSSVTLVRFDAGRCSAEFSLGSEVPFKEGGQLSFDLGVPFDINHLNPVTQPAPLNEPDMFWTWRNGYKFLRLDMRSNTDNWAWHLGSVGCVSASAVRSPEKECAKPNLTRQSVIITEENIPQGGTYRLVVHLDRLLGDIAPKRNNRCVMHGEREPACEQLFQNLRTSNVFSLESI